MSAYNDFLKTDDWKNARQVILVRNGVFCMKCGSGSNLNIHHSLYSGKLEVDIGFLFVLCQYCHHSFHNKYGVKADLRKETYEYLGINEKIAKLLSYKPNGFTKKRKRKKRR